MNYATALTLKKLDPAVRLWAVVKTEQGSQQRAVRLADDGESLELRETVSGQAQEPAPRSSAFFVLEGTEP